MVNLEAETLDTDGKPKFAKKRGSHIGENQLSLFAAQPHPVVERFRKMDLQNITPLEALNILNELRGAVVEKDDA